MANRQHGDPVVVESGNSVTALERVAFADSTVKERWVQEVLFANPSLLPIGAIEPAYAGLKPVARELPTGHGTIDLLCVNTSGYLTFIETKLVRNPEQRREVVAQVLDYTSQIARWSYDDLVDAVRRAHVSAVPGTRDPVLAAAQAEEADGDGVSAAQFRQGMSRALRVGRVLWLIVGDEIREDLEDLVTYLQSRAHLQFTLALVSLGLYRLPSKSDSPVLVVPRLISRTTEVVRAIVRFEGDENLKRLPEVIVPTAAEKALPGLEGYLERVDKQMTGSAEELRPRSFDAFYTILRDSGSRWTTAQKEAVSHLASVK